MNALVAEGGKFWGRACPPLCPSPKGVFCREMRGELDMLAKGVV